jgi:hypothetical protein
MFILSLISVGLIAALLMVMLTQARPWVKAKVTGKVIQSVPLGFWQKVRFHRSNLLALAMGILFCRLGGWMPENLAIFAGCFALAMLFLPMQYTFTSHGVAVGSSIFRQWEEFSGVTKKDSQIVLQHSSFFGRLTLFVKPVEISSVLNRLEKIYQ